MANGHGGPRQPARPAAVSNPQSGNRTDGGAGSKSQPLRVASGGGYGERKALTEQQQGAPLAAEPSAPSGGGPPTGGGGQAVSPDMGGGAFGPTQRPNEPITAGTAAAPQSVPDARKVLEAIYEAYPSPWIANLLYGK